MQFQYVAYNLKQGVTKGRVEARDLDEARVEVERNGYKPLRVSLARRMPSMEDLFPSFFGVGSGEVVRFARQMGTMLGSGASLVRSLEMIEAETSNGTLRQTLEDIRQTLEQGGSFSEAMGRHPRIFSPLFISVVEVGEYTGRLGPAMEQMADMLEKDHKAKQKAMQTMMYPLAIIGLSFITLLVLMTVALPPLLSVFESMDADIPLMTRMAVGGSELVAGNIVNIFFGMILAVIGLVLLRRIPRVRFWIDVAKAKAPVMGSFTVTGQLARFARTTSMLLDAGVSLSTALQLGTTSCGNLLIRQAFIDAEESLLTGHGVATALKKHPIIPGMFVQLVTIGEESNSLGKTLRDAADAFQDQHEQRLNTLLGLMEPATTVVVGGIVGFIAISMFVPIYSGLSAIK